MTTLDGTIFDDAERLKEHLADRGLRAYEDFEVLTATISDGGLEVDPCGRREALLPHLESFGAAFGYWVFPFDPIAGTISLVRMSAFDFDEALTD